MSKNTVNKKVSFLETTFADILVCKKSNFRPNIEVFIQKPENINQQGLGTLVGIFEITDISEDSSYIVNYLISIIKKEYYIKTKRGPLESFEAALHRVNLALTKLAEHGSIGWIGKINAIISVVEKNNIHLAQTGSAKALLIRENTLTDIAENSSEIEKHNPLKTFVDVISGRLEKNDKILLSTQDIFDIFSFEEIKKSALKFSSSEFIQFLKTALVNELEKASVLIIETKEKEILKIAPPISKNNKINVFSQASFSKISKNNDSTEKIALQEKQVIIDEIKEDLKKESSEFINKKTGHIYIKEDNFLQRKKSTVIELLENSKEKVHEIGQNISSVKWRKYIPKIPKKKIFSEPLISNEPPEKTTQEISSWKEKIYPNLKKKIFSANFLIWSKIKSFFSKSLIFLAKVKEASSLRKKATPNLSESKNDFPESSKDNFFQKINPNYTPTIKIEKQAEPQAQSKEFINKLNAFKKIFSEKIHSLLNILSKLLPKFSKIKNILSSLNSRQKIYTVFILFLLFVVPYFIVKIQDKPKEITLPNSNVLPPTPIAQPLATDKNIVRIGNLNQLDLGKEILEIINLNNAFFAISANEIIDLANNQTYPLNNSSSSIKLACGMDDLNLIFILDDKSKILSWSPISKKFGENKITLPENSTISNIKTYLTYLYILDQKNNQIYRYPRATEGFGEKTNWLKEPADLSQASNFNINEDIFLIQNGVVAKFSSGKKQDFITEETTTPIISDRVYTKRNSQYIYFLDKTNSRIIKLDLSGNIISQFYNSEISSATAFSINEENGLIYFSNKNYLKSFEANTQIP